MARFYFMYTKEHFTKKFGTWSSGNVNIDEIIQESQINNPEYNLRWIPYDNFQDTKYIADSEYFTLHSAILRNENDAIGECDFENEEYSAVNLRELKCHRYNILEFIKTIKYVTINGNGNYSYCFTRFFGISKNPSTQNYIIVMESCDYTIHSFLSNNFNNFLKFEWDSKIDVTFQIVESLCVLHENNLVHCDLHSGNILMKSFYGSIPYIPPEVLRGNEFTKEGDIYSLGGIMYEMATGNQPFADQAHDTYLMIDICNGVRPKVPDMMLNFIPKCYLDKMYQCWDDDPSKRPTARELYSWNTNIFADDSDDNIAMLNKFQEQKLLQSLYNFHSQSRYVSRNIYTLYGLQDSLEDIKSGKCADNINLVLKKLIGKGTY
ncbi:hypothetical protein Glove_48g84 [Diversispora epigaea]|uniref:Protein kinase domain-containing protein n=1 Tax=Diversispora epigaea TaxID=1348612 RepID=A0A397JE93_9GLOM|nr:hypothetical protein Glove_48g84 [Diversispora epigaea]